MHELNQTEKKRLTRSILISFSLYAVLFVMLILAPVPAKKVKEPVFKSVSITLTSPKAVVRKPEPLPVKADPIKPVVPEEKPKTIASNPAKVSPNKNTPKKPAATSAKSSTQTEPVPELQSQGLGIPNFEKPITSSRENTDAAEFIDFSSQKASSSPKRESLPPSGKRENELEGSLALVENATSSSQPVIVTSKDNKTSRSSSATEETSKSLEKITDSSISTSSNSSPTATVSSGVAKPQSLESSIPELTFDGATRRIIYPAKPEILLPESLAALIDSDRTVSIQFTVRADGLVPSGLVVFTPSAILPVAIRDYLRGEFSRWRFETGPTDGQAQFQYSIRVK